MREIFIVEDDDNIRELVCYALKSSGFEAVGFSTPQDFWRAIDGGCGAELLLLDIMLPGEDGIGILKRLKASKKTSSLPVILLTAKSEEYDRIKGLDLGADDYVTKPFSVIELISRVKAVLRRCGVDENPKRLEAGDISIDPEKRTVTAGGRDITLTYKEFELLYCLMFNRNIVLTRDKLMERVWGTDYEGETRTVDMHVKSLRQKLGESGDSVKTVRGVGYKLETGA